MSLADEGELEFLRIDLGFVSSFAFPLPLSLGLLAGTMEGDPLEVVPGVISSISFLPLSGFTPWFAVEGSSEAGIRTVRGSSFPLDRMFGVATCRDSVSLALSSICSSASEPSCSLLRMNDELHSTDLVGLQPLQAGDDAIQAPRQYFYPVGL